MNLNRRRKAKKRLPKRVRVPLYVPAAPDSVWSADFTCGRRFRTFNVVDDHNRKAVHWWTIEYNQEPTPRLAGRSHAH